MSSLLLSEQKTDPWLPPDRRPHPPCLCASLGVGQLLGWALRGQPACARPPAQRGAASGSWVGTWIPVHFYNVRKVEGNDFSQETTSLFPFSCIELIQLLLSMGFFSSFKMKESVKSLQDLLVPKVKTTSPGTYIKAKTLLPAACCLIYRDI